jgi:hypothetical protein
MQGTKKEREKGFTAIAVATCGRHGEQGRKMGGLKLPNCRQFTRFIETLLRFWYVCLIGPYIHPYCS